MNRRTVMGLFGLLILGATLFVLFTMVQSCQRGGEPQTIDDAPNPTSELVLDRDRPALPA